MLLLDAKLLLDWFILLWWRHVEVELIDRLLLDDFGLLLHLRLDFCRHRHGQLGLQLGNLGLHGFLFLAELRLQRLLDVGDGDVVGLRRLRSADLLGELLLQIPDLFLVVLFVDVEIANLLLTKLAVQLGVLKLLPEALKLLILLEKCGLVVVLKHVHVLASFLRHFDLLLHGFDGSLHFLDLVVLVAELLLALLPDHADLSVEGVDLELQLRHAPGVLALIVDHLLVFFVEEPVLLLETVNLRLV